MFLENWIVLLAGLAYVSILFCVATLGDKWAVKRAGLRIQKPLIYALSLGVYCTSWTYFGSVGVSSRTGFDFIPIYLGPILLFAFGWRLISRIVMVSKRENIASIADFISARYGKSQSLGALVAVIAVIGIVPYISIQLKALAFSLQTMMDASGWVISALGTSPVGGNMALLATVALALFSILFGTRHIDTTEHQDGMILAIAVESVVKLLAFMAVGIFVTFWTMGGIGPLLAEVQNDPTINAVFSTAPDGGRWLTMMLLSTCAIILLPRQFHVTVVENSHRNDVKRAAWLFPLYLIAINIFVAPIAIAGLSLVREADADTYVLALPIMAENNVVALIAFIGGLSAATAMVIMETIALSIMVCNNLVVPILLRRQDEMAVVQADMGKRLKIIRRIAICVILGLAYSYFLAAGNSAALAQTGLISFAAVAQFAPAFFGGLMWKRATARGARAGIIVGFLLWAYTLLLPSFIDSGWLDPIVLGQGPFGIGALRPRMLFGLEFDSLTHGVIWSLMGNIACYVGFSLMRKPTGIEQLQAEVFVDSDRVQRSGGDYRFWRSTVTTGQVEETVARYLGPDRARAAFSEMAEERHIADDPELEADVRILRFGELLLASAVGAASSRLVMALLLERHSKGSRGAMQLFDDASAAIQYNRELLQSAIDNVPQGIAVLDADYNLICWNLQYRALLALPDHLARVGVPISEIALALVDERANVATRLQQLTKTHNSFRKSFNESGRVIDVESDAMPDGGIVVTFTDVTANVRNAEALQSANETLERRVSERTAELTKLNIELAKAKAEADAANLGKTRFIAAASHDILQPLNAARLFTSSLVERETGQQNAELVRNVDASLEAVEDILSTVLDISRLDAGAMKPELSAFRLQDIFEALAREFAPLAKDKNLKLLILKTAAVVYSDKRLLRRILQNLLSNAIKYTPRGRVLMGVKRLGSALAVQVHDTGYGIAPEQHKLIFREFERLGQDKGLEQGLGLGLSIVERMGKVLRHPIGVRSKLNYGSVFSVQLPIAKGPHLPLIVEQDVTNPSLQLSGLRVLVIDNERTIVEGMRALLAGWGITIDAALSAAEAMGYLSQDSKHWDLIFADYHIDHEDGILLVQKMRQSMQSDIPAILITADRSKAVQDLAAAANVSYLRKPVRPAALRAMLMQLLASNRK